MKKSLDSLLLLLKGRRTSLVALYFLVLIAGVLESISIGSLYPIIDVLQDDKKLPVYISMVADYLPIGDVNPTTLAVVFIAIVAGVFITKNLLIVGVTYRLDRFIHNLQKDYVVRAHQYFFERPSSFFVDHAVGDLVQRANIQTSHAAASIRLILKVMVSSTLLTAIAITVFIFLPIEAFLAAAALFLIAAVTVAMTRKRLLRSGKRLVEVSRISHTLSTELIAGWRTVKLFNAMKPQLVKLHGIWGEQARMLSGNELVAVAPRPIIESILMLGGALLLIFYFQSGDRGGLNALPAIALLLGAVYRSIPLINDATMALMRLLPRVASLAMVVEMLEEPRKSADEIQLVSARRIVLDDVTYVHPGRKAGLSGLMLEFEVGKMYGIVGASGSGKSTLVDIICGFIRPQEGSVLVDGVSLDTADLNTWWSYLGVVPQNLFIFNGTIAENICVGSVEVGPDTEKVKNAARMADAHDFISGLPEGYNTQIGEGGIKLSGGQRQRLAIARALYKEPKIIILDEATSALDQLSESRVVSNIRKLVENGCMVILISHRLATIAKADLIYVLEGGRVIEQGTHSVLMEKTGTYQRLQFEP